MTTNIPKVAWWRTPLIAISGGLSGTLLSRGVILDKTWMIVVGASIMSALLSGIVANHFGFKRGLAAQPFNSWVR